MGETDSQIQATGAGGDAAVDPRRELWRRGSYEIVGDWIRPASVALLDRVEEALDGSLTGCTVLDVATGTGAVAIEAARRGATVTGVDLTDELVEIARRRCCEAGASGRFAVGDFDRLDDAIEPGLFDVVTSSFGVIFAPDATATAGRLLDRVRPGGLLAVTAWDPDGPFVVPDSLLELLPEPPPMVDLSRWAGGIDQIFARLPAEPVDRRVDVLDIGFGSAPDCAEQLERWSGGWTQMLGALDAAGVGVEARARLVEHLDSHRSPSETSFAVSARYHTTVLRRH